MKQADQFEFFAQNLFHIFKEFEARADDPNIPTEQQLIWAISANLVIKIAASAQAAAIQHEGTTQ